MAQTIPKSTRSCPTRVAHTPKWMAEIGGAEPRCWASPSRHTLSLSLAPNTTKAIINIHFAYLMTLDFHFHRLLRALYVHLPKLPKHFSVTFKAIGVKFPKKIKIFFKTTNNNRKKELLSLRSKFVFLYCEQDSSLTLRQSAKCPKDGRKVSAPGQIHS